MNGNPLFHLPSLLRQQLAELKHRPRQWQLTALDAVCNAAAWLLLSYLLLFVLDRFWNTPPWMRMALLGAGLGTAISWILPWLICWMDSAPKHDRAAFMQGHDGPRGRRALKALDLAQRRKRVVSVLTLLSPAIALSIVLPEASRSTFMRWLLPMSSQPRFTFVQIEGLPKELIVAHGESFELSFAVTCQSIWRPKTATASYPGGPSSEAIVRNGRAHFEFSGQTEPRSLILEAGDCSLRLKIKPLARPKLTGVAALVSLPPYLQHPPLARPLQNGKLHVIEGSRIVLKSLASRSLRKAWLNGSTRLSVSGSMVLTEELDVSKDEDMTLTWEDWHGLQSQDPMQITVVAQADQPPEIRVQNLDKTVAIQKDEILNLELSAGDDYGLKDIGLSFEIYSIKRATGAARRKCAFRLKKGSPKTGSLAVRYSFSPSALDIPPNTIVKLHATARDFRPDRKASVSQEHRIYVLGGADTVELPPRDVAKLGELPLQILQGTE